MVRVGVRDVGPVAWRMAVEFARPDRSRSPIVALAVAMLPMFVLIACVPGTRHWSRRVVLVLVHLVPGRRSVGAVWVLVALIAAVVACPSNLPRTTAAVVVLIVAAIIVEGSIARAIAVNIGYRARPDSGEVVPDAPAGLAIGPHDQWLIVAAAAQPGLDAMTTCFEPLLRRIVPAGESIVINAANPRLAAAYRERGFQQIGKKPLTLRLTMPCRPPPSIPHQEP